MSKILPAFLAELNRRGITEVGAAVSRENGAARRVLNYSGFTFERNFDSRQKLFQFSQLTSQYTWRKVS
ncbi:hypothetical protein ABDD95_19260 [Mucilaginibacter sp. PAMB04274]|uniref:hypothetical protein n=1 Tax=Mucilaginibacter sp. PAMB04274 TaxID=3138568 RepID=UPI0031F719EE